MDNITAKTMREKADFFHNKGKIEEIEESIYQIADKGGYNYGCKIENKNSNISTIVKHFQDNGFKVECSEQHIGHYIRFEW